MDPSLNENAYDLISWVEVLIGPIVAALLTVIAAIAVTYVTLNSQRRLARQKAVIDFIERRKWDHDYITSRLQFIRLRDDKDRPMKYWARTSLSDREERTIIRNILNDYELVAISINEQIFDANIYRKWYQGTFLRDYRLSKRFIEELREEEVAPDLYIHYERLAKDWSGNGSLRED